jgi:hypothetical protein
MGKGYARAKDLAPGELIKLFGKSGYGKSGRERRGGKTLAPFD